MNISGLSSSNSSSSMKIDQALNSGSGNAIASIQNAISQKQQELRSYTGKIQLSNEEKASKQKIEKKIQQLRSQLAKARKDEIKENNMTHDISVSAISGDNSLDISKNPYSLKNNAGKHGFYSEPGKGNSIDYFL